MFGQKNGETFVPPFMIVFRLLLNQR